MKNLLIDKMFGLYLGNRKVSIGNFWINSYKKFLGSLIFRLTCVINTIGEEKKWN